MLMLSSSEYQSLACSALAEDVEAGGEAAVDGDVHDVSDLHEFEFESEVKIGLSISISINSDLNSKS